MGVNSGDIWELATLYVKLINYIDPDVKYFIEIAKMLQY